MLLLLRLHMPVGKKQKTTTTKKTQLGNSLVVQELGLGIFIAKGPDSIPGPTSCMIQPKIKYN